MFCTCCCNEDKNSPTPKGNFETQNREEVFYNPESKVRIQLLDLI